MPKLSFYTSLEKKLPKFLLSEFKVNKLWQMLHSLKGISPGTGSLQFSDLTGCEVSDRETNNHPQP